MAGLHRPLLSVHGNTGRAPTHPRVAQDTAHQPLLPGTPLNGPTTSSVTQPP